MGLLGKIGVYLLLPCREENDLTSSLIFFRELIRSFYIANGKRKPERIIFYRLGLYYTNGAYNL